MDKIDSARNNILNLIIANFGKSAAGAFSDSYKDKPLPIYTDGALQVLSDLLGKEKAESSLREIFINLDLKVNYV